MNKLIESIKSASLAKAFKTGAVKFIRDEEGAQIVEYALIIAVVSIGMIVLLRGLLGGAGNPFAAFITRVTNCLSTTTCS